MRQHGASFLAIVVFEQGNARRAVRIVLDGNHPGPDAVLAAFEVDEAIHAFVAAATEARAHDTVEIAAALLGLGQQQRLLGFLLAIGNLGEITDGALAASSSHRFVLTNTHKAPNSQ